MESYPTNWWHCFSHNPSSGQGYIVWWQGAARYNTHYALDVFAARNDEPDGYFTNKKYCVRYNSYSNKRIGQQPTVFLKDDSTGVWFPAGTIPGMYIPFSGLAHNEEIQYGSERFRCHPTLLMSYDWGFAIRTV